MQWMIAINWGREAMLTNKIPNCAFLRGQKGETSLKKRQIGAAMGNAIGSLTVAVAPSQHLMNGQRSGQPTACSCRSRTYPEAS
uniref:Transcriptional regulator n=1 Tax=Loa loa TaxID=7209 RepID=A0A1I7W437_LOALO